MAVTWEDEGIVLAVRGFGEHDAILSLLTENHGRHLGLIKGGGGKTKRGMLQPANLVRAAWRARLDEQLGNFTLEPVRNFGAEALSSPDALAGLSSLCAMAEATLPEREPHPAIYRHTRELLAHLDAPGWAAEYVRWELALLRDMGYGLDLGSCAATGASDDLDYVSPRSGRAVSRAAAEPYRARLLALPAFLRDRNESAGMEETAQGLALTAHFFDAHVFHPHRRELPAARVRYAARLAGGG